MGPVRVVNMRGRELEVVGSSLEWVSVVVLEHPHPPPDLHIPVTISNCRVMLRSDWEFLWDQLKSTVAVLAYLSRTAALESPPPLGQESHLYYRLALADEVAEPAEMPEQWRGSGATTMSPPLLPIVPAGDEMNHFVLRQLMEDIGRLTPKDEQEHVRIIRALAALDSLPVAARGQLGAHILERFNDLPSGADEVRWSFRLIRQSAGEGPQVLIATCSGSESEAVRDAFKWRVELAHDEWAKSGFAPTPPFTVGVMMSASERVDRPWHATIVAIEGAPYLDEVTLEIFRQFWFPDR